MNVTISNVKNSAVALANSIALNENKPPPATGLGRREKENEEQYIDRCERFIRMTKGLKKSKSRIGLFALLGKTKVNLEEVMALRANLGIDHSDLWNKDGVPYIFTSHVYMLEWDKLQKLVDFCRDKNLELEVSAEKSWYNPGHTILCIIKKRKK